MAKEDIFSKINFKDYNNELENILEQKDFSSDVKNLLLSMLYKIENSYQDYKIVKVNVSTKKYFLEKIIEIIQKECNQIQLVKPLTEESKALEEKNVHYIVDKENEKITVYPNERMLLEALVALHQKEIEIEEKYDLFSLSIKEVLTKGNQMNIVEVIRDFNGWSWDITPSQMESKNINIVYQNLLILLGNHFLNRWITDDTQEQEEIELPSNEILRSKYNDSFGMTKEETQEENKIDFLQKMQEILVKRYGEELGKKYFEQFIKTVIALGCNRNQIQKEKIIKKQEEIQETINLMKDNKKYLETISNQKKKLSLDIKKIDTLLSDVTLLKEEYQERNRKLPNKQKIFSVSHLKIMLEKERENLLKQIQECNKQMEPQEFVIRKKILEEQNQFFQNIEIKEKEKTNETKQIDVLQEYFIECFKVKIKSATTKKELSNLLYELRYYEQIPYEQTERNQEKIKQAEKELINKACLAKLLITFSEQADLNQKILSHQFQSKIINLENTIYILKYHKGILKIQINDGNVEEETREIQITKKVELQVKLNKKIKIWE